MNACVIHAEATAQVTLLTAEELYGQTGRICVQ